jgi:hypothetical protein
MSADANDQSNTIEATGANGTNNITANATTGTNNIEAANNNIGVTTENSVNTIGNSTSTNVMTGATNTITGETTISSEDGSHVVSVTNSNIHLSGGYTGITITGNTESEASNSIVMVADNDNSNTNARSRFAMDSTSVSLLVNTDTGESHGIEISQTSTVISGGTNSTTLTLDDNGATFADTATSGPARVMGVAEGVNDYDAVNVRQFKREISRLDGRIDKSYAGIASVAALSAIPAPVAGKNVSVGMGYGNFSNQNAVAFGAKALVGEQRDITLSAGIGYCDSSATISAGLGWSF